MEAYEIAPQATACAVLENSLSIPSPTSLATRPQCFVPHRPKVFPSVEL
jgi:hypothetical protein